MRQIFMFATASLALPLMTGCADKAEPDFKRCQAAEGRGDLASAVTACEMATAADSSSQAGKAAAERLVGLRASLAKKQADDEAKRAAEQKAKADAQARLAAFRAKVRFETINLSAYGVGNQCALMHQPPRNLACRSAVKDGDPGDEDACAAVAGAAGCKKEAEKQRTWCCPDGTL